MVVNAGLFDGLTARRGNWSVHLDVIVQRCIAWLHRPQQPATDCPRTPTTAFTAISAAAGQVTGRSIVACHDLMIASAHHTRGQTYCRCSDPTDSPADDDSSSWSWLAVKPRQRALRSECVLNLFEAIRCKKPIARLGFRLFRQYR